MRLWFFCISLIIAMCFLAGCDKGPEFYVEWVKLIDQTVCTAGHILYAKTTPVLNPSETHQYTYQWTATGGTIEDASKECTTWYAPTIPGTYYITLKVTRDRVEVVKTRKVEVVSSPMTVTSLVVGKDIEGDKQITMSVKNENNSKTIIAFKVKIAVWNAFNERIWWESDYSTQFFEYCFADVNVKPGETVEVLQNVYRGIATGKAFVYQVQYSDGTGWKVDSLSEYHYY